MSLITINDQSLAKTLLVKITDVKNMKIIDKPEPSSKKTYNATYPAYISDFQTSDDADGIGRWFFSKIY